MATPSDKGNDLAVVPAGTPVAHAALRWSTDLWEEVILRATRPSSLSEPIRTEAEVQISPPREGLDWDLALTSIVEENLRLRKEIMEINGMAGGVVVKHTSMGLLLLLCLLKERLSMEGTNRELMEG
ncbi:unnamed protein product [Effrenium voratum]|uniref:Uncharacterized protein n=1 Tax=Effrenium voratum TaxID=2562239 RepID=A0AA36MNE2_9DINO|nr:unnamed protein product [Effrenium voratum]